MNNFFLTFTLAKEVCDRTNERGTERNEGGKGDTSKERKGTMCRRETFHAKIRSTGKKMKRRFVEKESRLSVRSIQKKEEVEMEYYLEEKIVLTRKRKKI